MHRWWRGDPLRSPLGQQVHGFGLHCLTERQLVERYVGKKFAERARVDDCPREVVLAEALRFLQEGNVEISRSTSRLLILLDQSGQLDGARQPRGPSPTIRTSISTASAFGASRKINL